ncbi:unannotated protein [freshwater metagenome]|uniref:Unannotated protein n=1 Tax=freshwater metagenome TaxID=449393 RepID=A0A6J6WZL8_9ZZZZ
MPAMVSTFACAPAAAKSTVSFLPATTDVCALPPSATERELELNAVTMSGCSVPALWAGPNV